MAKKPKFLVIDGCPAPYQAAPYIYLILRRAGQQASSIYRGSDPEGRAILHRHGKHTQAELYDSLPPGTANRPGTSEHELFSDGRARRGPIGRRLRAWGVGVDSGTNDAASKARIDHAAAFLGLHVGHPYNAGVEGHHWHFTQRPRPNRHLSPLTVIRTRRMLRKVR